MADRSHIPVAVVARVRAAARDRCGYCRASQKYVLGPLELDHIVPVSGGGGDEESNLWLACSVCNSHKSGKMTGVDPESGAVLPLFNPRSQRWADHFRWSEDGIRVVGRTPTGRATVAALQLATDIYALQVRESWVSAGWQPPKDDD